MTESFLHDSRDTAFRNPFGAQPTGTWITLALIAPADAQCSLRLWSEEDGSQLLPMLCENGRFSLRLQLPEHAGVLWYFFIIDQAGQRSYLGAPSDGLGGRGVLYDAEPPAWQITVYEHASVPQWYKNAIVYQIFPDRFFRGEDRLLQPAACTEQPRRGPRRIWHADWDDTPFYTKDLHGLVTRWDFFGGTLSGICQKLPELKTLGVGALYLNPIFRAASNHRYDTADYMQIDPLLGNEEIFRTLCRDAHALGIRIILDGVFSHTGADSRYFDLYGNYGGGACSDPDSPYRSWYRFRHWPDDYECWWGVGDLPNVNEEEPGYKSFILGVIRHWLRLGADGWRLDVADELPDSFIADLRSAVRAEKADALLLGEVWEDASRKYSYGQPRRYLLGQELDCTMHYPFLDAVSAFLLGSIDSAALARRLDSIAENYPPEAQYAALNLIGSHDRPRAITVLSGAQAPPNDAECAQFTLSPEQYSLGVSRLKLAALLQFACPGVPCIYYGDEAGLQGWADPYNRAPYPWGRENRELMDYYRRLGAVYHSHPVLKDGSFQYENPDTDVFICRRWDQVQSCVAVVNRSFLEKQLPLCGIDLFTGAEIKNRLFLPPLGGALIMLE